ncbi:MAG: CPBP family intramembrane metalloprotease [Clostridiales bacterium]|jgi:membrane protease YdiL (CAAX protease family)|nr:CPBP family intramembrane metalloprotease [Clostridiales bacterium]
MIKKVNFKKMDAKTASSLAVFVSLLLLTALNVLLNQEFIKLSDNQIDIYYTLISQILILGIIPILILSGSKINVVEHACIKPIEKGKLPTVLLIAAAMIFVNLFVAGINQNIINVFGFTSVNSAGMILDGVDKLALALFLSAILPPLFEEFLIRGVFLGAFKDRPMTGIVLSAFMFGLMHTNIEQFMYAFVGGLVMGVVFIKTGSVLSTFLIHMFINAFSVIMQYGIQNPSSPLGAFYGLVDMVFSSPLIYLALVGVCIYLTVKGIKKLDIKEPINMNPRDAAALSGSSVALIAGAITLGVLLTIFSFIWGIVR